MKTGFKATYDYVCRDHKFEIGQTYELEGTPIICEYGFHYCQNPKDVLRYYLINHVFRLLEIEDLGESITEGNKSVTNKIRIIREVPKEEYYFLFGIINNELIINDPNGYWEKRQFDERNNCINFKDSFGYWEKRSFDERNNLIYSEDSFGNWFKREYDERNNVINFKDSCGYWEKLSYDERNNCISVENSNFCEKYSYDENGMKIIQK